MAQDKATTVDQGEKRPYHRPELLDAGSIADLTLGGGKSGTDSVAYRSS